MSSSRWKTGVIGFLAVLVIIEAGVIWRQGAETVSAAGTGIGERGPEKTPRELSPEAAKVDAAAETIPPGEISRAVSRLRVLIEAKGMGFATQVPAIAPPTWTLQPKFARLFALKDHERTRLQRAIDSARAETNRLELENATTARADDGSVVVQVKSYAGAGGAPYDQLMREFAETLGPERNAAFLALSADPLEGDFGGFGTREKKFTITWQPKNESYKIIEEYKSPGVSRTSFATVYLFADIARSRPALALLQSKDVEGLSDPVAK